MKAAILTGADRNQACELHFYLATFDLLKDMQDEARRDLENALHNCPPGGMAFAAAQAELAALNRKH
jgi:hypothetical protein